MPSDLAKKKAAKKKEAAKARQRPRKGHEENGDAATEPQVAEEKYEANGREATGELRARWAPGMVVAAAGPQAAARGPTPRALDSVSGATELFTGNGPSRAEAGATLTLIREMEGEVPRTWWQTDLWVLRCLAALFPCPSLSFLHFYARHSAGQVFCHVIPLSFQE